MVFPCCEDDQQNKANVSHLRGGFTIHFKASVSGFSLLLILLAHHHASGHSDPPATVGVGDDVTVADAEEGDGYQPHGVQEVSVLLVMIPEIKIICSSGHFPKSESD